MTTSPLDVIIVIMSPLLGYPLLLGYSHCRGIPIAGVFLLRGYSCCGGTSYDGLHSLNLFVSHSIHITSFRYFATLVLSVTILCVVWGILCLICFLFVSHLVPQFIFRRGILFRMKLQCCWVGISLMQR